MGNTFEALSDGFSDDFLVDMIREGASAANAFDSATFNLWSGLSSWVADLNAGARNHVVVMGDSNVAHTPGSDTTRWAQILRTELATLTGLSLGGEGFRLTHLSEFSRNTPASPAKWTAMGVAGPFPLNVVDGPVAGATQDVAPNGMGWSGLGTAAELTWTKPGTFAAYDRFQIWSQGTAFGTTQGAYKIDGGAFVGTAFPAGSFLTTFDLVSQEIVGAPASTLTLRGTNLTPAVYNGVSFYQGTTGLVVNNLAYPGGDAAQMVGRDLANRLDIIDKLQPKLTILWTGTNDFGRGTHRNTILDAWYKNIKAIADRGRLHGDVLLIYPQSMNTPELYAKGSMSYGHADFERLSRKVAYETDSAFISIHALWGEYARHNARGYVADDVHLSDAGHKAVARFISRAIERVS